MPKIDLEEIRFHDSLRVPTIYETRIDSYKEWLHFNVFDQKNELFIMLNFGLTGNIFLSRRGIVSITCVIVKDGKIVSTIENKDTEELTISYLRPYLNFGKNSVDFNNKCFHVVANIDTLGVVFDLEFEPVSEPILAEAKHFGTGSIGWFSIPRLSVSGSMEMNGSKFKIIDCPGYHDHDWGYFNWGERIGWEWGVFTENNPSGTTMVFDQRTSGIRGTVNDKVLYIYQGKKLKMVIRSDQLQIRLDGTYRGQKVITPGLMRILYPYSSSIVPARITVRGLSSNRQTITLEFTTRKLVQVIVPNHNGNGATQLNQLFGSLNIKNTIEEIHVKKDLLGYLESVGPI